MKEEKIFGIDPEIKKQINATGFEGGAAVFVGSPEEIEKAKQIAETEGRTEDLGTYIKLHKQVWLPVTELPESGALANEISQESMLKLAGQAYLGGTEVVYVDKEGSLCEVIIDLDKIAQLKDLWEHTGSKSELEEKLRKMLESLQFKAGSMDNKDNNIEFGNKYQQIMELYHKYQERLAREASERNSKEFDF